MGATIFCFPCFWVKLYANQTETKGSKVLYNRGFAYYEKGEYDRAIWDFDKAKEVKRIAQEESRIKQIGEYIENFEITIKEKKTSVKRGKSNELKDSRINFSFGLGLGYHQIGNADIKELSDMGMGEVTQSSLQFSGNIGIHISLLERLSISCLTGYSFGSAGWENAFGSGLHAGMTYGIWDLDFEMKFLFPLHIHEAGVEKAFVFPFVGIGPTLSYNLTDREGDGFINGGGDLHYNLGVGTRRLYGSSCFDIRLLTLIRPSYEFEEFKLGSTTTSENYKGTSYSIMVQMFYIL